MVIVVMGVSGAGKTTVGRELAQRLGVDYAEADEFHPPENIAKMSSGTPLTDEDRWPWLHSIADWIKARQHTGGVVTSSALKRKYRDVLRSGGDVFFVHLDGTRELIAERLAARKGHFMPPALLDSQIADLEPLQPDERGIVLDIDAEPDELVEAAFRATR
ncbi:gluconokinase [Kibdelosporangium philippinense]|uniref:Gluconokinase n=1 Tax=Kibdelosporangium philippinense TaxID=211113 RepID=A0ABS8ZN36_9PSEU|nr:gluconokinase [Kibdelosporangium philippinense]MCE7008365.1 gluconokinase [Kibdelosporangium philippinense]